MANPCKITGMWLFDQAAYRRYHGDLYEVEETYVVRAVAGSATDLGDFKQGGPEKYLLLPSFAPAGSCVVFCDEGMLTYIIPKNWAVLSDAAQKYIADSLEKYGP